MTECNGVLASCIVKPIRIAVSCDHEFYTRRTLEVQRNNDFYALSVGIQLSVACCAISASAEVPVTGRMFVLTPDGRLKLHLRNDVKDNGSWLAGVTEWLTDWLTASARRGQSIQQTRCPGFWKVRWYWRRTAPPPPAPTAWCEQDHWLVVHTLATWPIQPAIAILQTLTLYLSLRMTAYNRLDEHCWAHSMGP